MKTKREQLQELIDQRNPELALGKILANKSLAEYITKMDSIEGAKGEPGYTPVKGKDYFTQEEVNLIVNHIQSRVKNGDKGEPGIPGAPGKDGQTPFRGIDYWTSADQEKILKDVLSAIPKPTKEKPIDVNDLIKKVKDATPQVNYKEEIGKILASPGFRMLLHGGGLSTVSHDSTLTGDGTPSNPLHVVSMGSGVELGGSQTGFSDGMIQYIDQSGLQFGDTAFTRDSGVQKQTDFASNTYAIGISNDGVVEVNFMADVIGTTGNSIALVFDGVQDAATVLAAWNLANPSNTATIVSGVGTTVPTAGTVNFVGGGTAGYSSGVFANLAGATTQGSSLFSSDPTNNLGAGVYVGNSSLALGQNGLSVIIGAGNLTTQAISAGIFQTGSFNILASDQTTYNTIVYGDDIELRLQHNNLVFAINDGAGGFIGWADNNTNSSFQLPVGVPASTSYVLGVSGITGNNIVLDWVLSGGLTGYTTATPNTALGIDTAADGIGTNNTWLGYKAGVNYTAANSSTFVGNWATIGAIATAVQSVIVGAQDVAYAWAGGTGFIGIGYNTISGTGIGSFAIAMGHTASSTGTESIAIGKNAGATSDFSIAIGSGASTIGHNNSIAIGTGAINTASAQMVVGSSTSIITDFYFGNGVTNAGLPNPTAFHATGGSGANNSGASFTIYGGQSTGNVAGGFIQLAVSPAGTAGSTPNTYHTFLEILASKTSTFGDVDDAYHGLKLAIDNNAGGINLGNTGGAGGNSTRLNIADLSNTITNYVSGVFGVSTTGGTSVFTVDTTNLVVNSPYTISSGTLDTMVVHGATITANIQANSDTQAIYESHSHSNTAGNGSVFYGARSRGTTASPTIVASGDFIRIDAAVAYDGTDYEIAGYTYWKVDGTPGSNDMPGRYVIATTPSGSFSAVDRMSVTSSGEVLVGTTSTGNSSRFTVVNTSQTSGVSFNVQTTQTTPHATDTGDGAMYLQYVMSANSATNALVNRVLNFSVTNSLTGGGVMSNIYAFNIATSTSTGTTTTHLASINLETGTTAGTVTNGYGLYVTSLQGTNKYAIYDTVGTKWVSASGGQIGIGTTSPATSLDIQTSTATENVGQTIKLGNRTYLSQLDVNTSAYFTFNTYFDGATFRSVTAATSMAIAMFEGSVDIYSGTNGGAGGSNTVTSVFQVTQLGSTVIGSNSALATNATDGFLYIPTSAGAPTGTPTAKTGKVAMEYDTSNNFLYVYNGAWKKILLA